MKRGSILHLARPDWWPPTKRPWATPGELVAASVTCLSRQEAVPPCLCTSPPLGGTLEVHRTSWRILFPRHACMSMVLGIRGAWVSHAPPRVPKQRRSYPRSPCLVWPGHLNGTGCLSARAMDTGFPIVVRRLCLGPGSALARVWVTLPALAGVLAGCILVRVVVSPLHSRLAFVVFAVELGFRLAPHHSWLGFRRGAWLCARSACTLPFPARVCDAVVCA